MRADTPLFSTLDQIAKHGTRQRRAEMLERITGLFIEGAGSFTEEQVAFFGEVFNRLLVEIEAKARFELSVSLAGLSNAPSSVVRQLANDGDISVARPVLQLSLCLEDSDLLDVAESKSQQHLLAISDRSQINESITDVLVRRGDRDVVRNVAGNSGARLSLSGFSTLVRKAEKDGILAEKVGQRADIPQPLLRILFTQATHVVQKRLFATATRETRAKILHILEVISNGHGISVSLSAGVDDQIAILPAQPEFKLDEMKLARFAGEGKHEETILGLSRLCGIPMESMHRIMEKKSSDPVLVVCKALGFGWQTAQAIILLQTRGLGISELGLENKNRNFDKLSISGCQEIMRLWCAMHDGDRPNVLAEGGR